jgi:hypothetical protein
VTREGLKRRRRVFYGGEEQPGVAIALSHAAWQPLEPSTQRAEPIGWAGLEGQLLKSWAPSLFMMEVMRLRLWRACGGISTSSPVAEVKRMANESPYTIALDTALRRGAIASELTKFQDINCLRYCMGTVMV